MSGPARVGAISTVKAYELGQGEGSAVSTLRVQFQDDGVFDGSVTLKARAQRGSNSDILRTVLAVPYINTETGDVSTAAITGDLLILVDASGLVLYGDCTTVTTGSLAFTSIPLLGTLP